METQVVGFFNYVGEVFDLLILLGVYIVNLVLVFAVTNNIRVVRNYVQKHVIGVVGILVLSALCVYVEYLVLTRF